MAKLISNLSFSAPHCFEEIDSQILFKYSAFACTGFRMDKQREEHIRQRILTKQCTLCGGTFRSVYEKEYLSFAVRVHESVIQCKACGNWKGKANTSISDDEWLLPYLREFCPQKTIPALNVLLNEIKATPGDLFLQKPRQFELLVGSVLRNFFKCDVYHVGQSRDGGIDLIVIEADEPIMVQVKRREKTNSVEGLDVVKLLFASMYARGAKKGMLVTTAQRFSADAKSWVHLPSLKDNEFNIELVTFDRLMAMTKTAVTSEVSAWESALSYWHDKPSGFIFEEEQIMKHPKKHVFRFTVGDKDVTWDELDLFHDDGNFVRVDKGSLFCFSSGTGNRPIYFSDIHPSKCWEIPRAMLKDSFDKLMANENLQFDTNAMILLTDEEFYTILRSMSRIAVNQLVKSWSLTSGDNAVSWKR